MKAVELKLLGLDQEAAKELASLPERYAKDRAVIMELCGLLSDVGEYHQALRLTRLYFRESIERGGATLVPERLWAAAYPTAYLPLIRNYAGFVDPFLAGKCDPNPVDEDSSSQRMDSCDRQLRRQQPSHWSSFVRKRIGRRCEGPPRRADQGYQVSIRMG